MCALVTWVRTLTVTEPATPASPPPPPATAPEVRLSVWRARTIRPVAPLASMVAAPPMAASAVVFLTSVVFEKPTPAVAPKARPPA